MMEEASDAEAVRTFPFTYLEKFFDLDKKNSTETTMAVTCKLCSKNKILKAVWSSSSNLRKHITRVHPAQISQMNDAQEKTKKRALIDDSSNKTESPVKKQCTLPFSSNQSIISQTSLDRLIINFISGTLQPFSIVDNEYFIQLINGLAPTKKVMCRKTVTVRLKEKFDLLKKRLTSELLKTEAVVTTADCWSHFKKSYLGMTVHWVDLHTLKRKSAMLAIQRLRGSHTYDVLSAAIDSVHKEFGIQNKVSSCVTDNGSNFVKAFLMFGEKICVDDERDEDNDDANGVDSTENSDAENNEEANFVEITEVLDEGQNDVQFLLPPHQRCAAHTLNLVAVKDSQTAEQDANFKKMARSTFARCQALWNKQRSTLAADMIKETLERSLVTPNATRWNSTYESVKCLVNSVKKCGHDKLDSLLDSIGLARIRPMEIEFLNEYLSVMKPVAIGLNILQSEKNMYIGYLLPTISRMKEELAAIKERPLKHCKPLAVALLNGVNKRFEKIFEDKKLIVAAGLIPATKFSWSGNKKEAYQKILQDELLLHTQETDSAVAKADFSREEEEADEEFLFFNSNISDESNSPCIEELKTYSATAGKEVEVLLGFPSLKQLFIKFNTGIPSSAPVERLFSIAKEVLTPRRGRLSDSAFSMQLFCNINQKFL